MIKVHEVEQGTAEWAELRAGKYTGSNAHKLLKFGAIDYSLTSSGSFRGNYYTKRGHILEKEAIELYEQITGTVVSRPGFITNDNFAGCGYSPDGLTDDLVIEVKCFNRAKHLNIYNGVLPLEVLAQIHFGMLICGRRAARLLIYNPELEPRLAFKIIPIQAKRSIESNLKRILANHKEVALA